MCEYIGYFAVLIVLMNVRRIIKNEDEKIPFLTLLHIFAFCMTGWTSMLLIRFRDESVLNMARCWFIATLLLYLIVFIRQTFYGMKYLIPLGGVCNAIAIATNDGKMPVDINVINRLGWAHVADSLHSISSAATRFTWLIDRWYYSPLLLKDSIFSIGDVLLFLGFVITAAQLCVRDSRRQ